jgi:hypothetical protein
VDFRLKRYVTLGTLGLAAWVSGCGLSEYEANMASEQARVHRLEEENKYLDDPIEWPAKKDSDKKETGRKETSKKDSEKPYVDVFFRPPRGIKRTPNQQQHGPLYVFPRSSDNTGAIQEIWIGAAVNQADFARDVTKLFVPAGGSVTKPTHSDKQPPGRKEPLSLDTSTYEDAGSTYSINIYKKGNIDVAVVYHIDKTKSSETTAKVEMSLESLAIDADAAQQRRLFNTYHQKGRGK